jgi:hypothetical protein
MMSAAPRHRRTIFLNGQGRAAGLVMVRNVHCTLVIVREDLLVIRNEAKRRSNFLKFTAFLGAGPSLDQLAVLSCFCTIVLRFEHAEPFR